MVKTTISYNASCVYEVVPKAQFGWAWRIAYIVLYDPDREEEQSDEVSGAKGLRI